MFTKNTVFLLLIVLMMGSIVFAQSKGTIVFLTYDPLNKIDPETGESPDNWHIYALEDDGYEVIPMYTTLDTNTTQATLDTLYDLADLIVMGRSTPSTGYGDNKAAWNAIPTPILCLEMWALRNNRLNWLNTASINSFTTLDTVFNAKIMAPNDPVFAGVDIPADSLLPWINQPWDKMGIQDAGNGEILARMETDSTVLFVRWEPGVEFYPEAGDTAGGYRSMIGNGRDSGGDPPYYYYNFTPESEQVFLNEVAYLIDITAIEDQKNTSIPSTFELLQNYPNPFNPSTTIPFNLSENSNVRISLVNILGEEIAEIANGKFNRGYNEVVFNANNLTSGIYFYRIETDKFSDVKKLVLLK